MARVVHRITCSKDFIGGFYVRMDIASRSRFGSGAALTPKQKSNVWRQRNLSLLVLKAGYDFNRITPNSVIHRRATRVVDGRWSS